MEAQTLYIPYSNSQDLQRKSELKLVCCRTLFQTFNNALGWQTDLWEFEASLAYRISSRTAKATQNYACYINRRPLTMLLPGLWLFLCSQQCHKMGMALLSEASISMRVCLPLGVEPYLRKLHIDLGPLHSTSEVPFSPTWVH